jgi:D-alanine-D-alanine ligase
MTTGSNATMDNKSHALQFSNLLQAANLVKSGELIPRTTKIAVLYGGLSGEREISLRSGKNCFAALERLGFANSVLIDVNQNIAKELKDQKVEIAFLALHGQYGEDGVIQGILELLQIPYTGSGVLASALAINKILTKQVLKANGLPSAEAVTFGYADSGKASTTTLPPTPVMVKPQADGSSLGVVKVDNAKELPGIIEETITKYGGAVVESFIKGQEITIGVIERAFTANGTKQYEYQALPVLELRPKSKAGFYDFEAKYTKGMTEFILPAELNETTTKLVQELAIKTFRALNCRGYARVDMIVDAQGKPFILEVNTLPGMTDTSDLPAMAQEAGIGYDELVSIILSTAGLNK